jgi:hypothetical protein
MTLEAMFGGGQIVVSRDSEKSFIQFKLDFLDSAKQSYFSFYFLEGMLHFFLIMLTK